MRIIHCRVIAQRLDKRLRLVLLGADDPTPHLLTRTITFQRSTGDHIEAEVAWDQIDPGDQDLEEVKAALQQLVEHPDLFPEVMQPGLDRDAVREAVLQMAVTVEPDGISDPAYDERPGEAVLVLADLLGNVGHREAAEGMLQALRQLWQRWYVAAIVQGR